MTTPRLAVGDVAPPLELTTLAGAPISVPDPAQLVNLQFRRFAGCPICNLHLRTIARRVDELRTAGVREVALFHSTPESMAPFQGDLPFDVVADPERHAYQAYAVAGSLRSVLDPRAWPAFVRGALARHPSSSTRGEGGHTGLPADFLVAPDGRLVAVKYGSHADDQWSVDELLERVAAAQRPSPPPTAR